MPAAPATLRCFVALWPDVATRSAIEAIARVQHQRFPRARLMRAENLHLTLAFIGALPLDAVRTLQPHINTLAAPSDPTRLDSTTVCWTLDRLGSFPGARVLWLGGPRSAAVHALADAVRRCLDAHAIPYDRRPFVPHITLLRDLPRDTPVDEPLLPLPWQVGAPRLVVSTTSPAGVTYRDAAQVL